MARVPEQLVRIGVLTVALVVIAGVLRFAVIPGSFFASEIHRSSTVEAELKQPIRFAGGVACAECHEEIAAAKAAGHHESLGCESCHGPAADHAEEPFEAKPFAPRDRKSCPVCHTYDPARPTGFPQINPTAHNPLRACVSCHDPHVPVPPELPRECAACHAQIARTKALSSHALLECTTCHEARQEHRLHPRSALPTIPDKREFCGQCHGRASEDPHAPKVDMASHGNSYLCWDCHYPHLPEGGL